MTADPPSQPASASPSVGAPVPIFEALPPTTEPICGNHVLISPLSIEKHLADLWVSIGSRPAVWTYIPVHGPFENIESFRKCLEILLQQEGQFYAISLLSPAPGTPATVGICTLFNTKATHRAIELGFVVFSPLLQRTSAATETFYLLSRHVFEECKYRRYVWKCDNMNEPSKNAALRLGFVPEGVHRWDLIVKGRNRDTAWFSMGEEEWFHGGRKEAFEVWLGEGNFDVETGRRKKGLREIREELLAQGSGSGDGEEEVVG